MNLYLNNDVLSIINLYTSIEIKNKRKGFGVSMNCECCDKKIRFTENTYNEQIRIPSGLIEIKREYVIMDRSHFEYIFGNTSDSNIFGVIKINDKFYDYKEYLMEHGTKESINNYNGDKYTIDWAKVPENVKVYADQSKTNYIMTALFCNCVIHRQKNIQKRWESLTTIPYSDISFKIVKCYKCRSKKIKNVVFLQDEINRII